MRKVLQPNEISDILFCVRNDSKILTVFSLACFSGLRENEIATLEWKDVKCGREFLRWFVPTCPKKNNQMPALLNDISRAAMQKQYNKVRSKYVLGRHYYPESLWRIWIKLQLSVWGFKKFCFHDLRHTAITNYYKATRDLELTRQFARHKSFSSTQLYVHLAESERMEQILTGITSGFSKLAGVIGV